MRLLKLTRGRGYFEIRIGRDRFFVFKHRGTYDYVPKRRLLFGWHVGTFLIKR